MTNEIREREPSPQAHAAAIKTIDRAASDVQTMAYRVRALTLAAKWMLEENSPFYGETFTKAHGERISATEQFIDMIGEVVEKMREAGEGIEKAGFSLRLTAGRNAQVQA